MGSLLVNSQINSVIVDPRNPKIVFAAGPAGIFRSDDAGLNWKTLNQNLGAVIALALNPNQPDTMFAATVDGALFRSDDAAQSWKSISQ